MPFFTIRGCAFVVVLYAAASLTATCESGRKPKPTYPFYAYQNGMSGVPQEQQAKLLKELGYDGVAGAATPRMLEALDAQRLKLFCIFGAVDLDPDKPSYSPRLKPAIERLNGRDTLISLFVRGGEPSSDKLDDRAVGIVRELAGMAEKSGLRIAFYPHAGLYVARVEDGVRLSKKVDRKNVGFVSICATFSSWTTKRTWSNV
jgi:sugar phosphate isomerase/epimerase